MKRLTTQAAQCSKSLHFPQSLRRFCFGLPLFILLASMPLEKLNAQAVVTGVSFTQYNRYGSNEQLLFQNSSLGGFSFSAIPDKSNVYYLNVFAKTATNKDAWIVQNLPVAPDSAQTPTTCQSVYIDYKLLEIQPGVQVNQVNYTANITPTLMQAQTTTTIINDTVNTVTFNPNTFVHNNAVASRSIFNSSSEAMSLSVAQTFVGVPVSRGALLHELSADYAEATDLALFSNTATVAAPVAKDRDIPGDVEEKPNGCAPGAFARSIAWLEGKHNFVAGKNPQDIYDTLQKRMDTCKNYNPCMIKVKDDFLKEKTKGKGTTRRIMPITSPADTIKKYPDCDIELDIQQLPNEGMGHWITIVSIQCGNDGCCTIKYRDDSLQGKPGGDKCVKTAKICGDSITTDKKRKIRSLVIECVSGNVNREAAPPVTDKVLLLPNVPNPFNNITTLRVEAKETQGLGNAMLTISNDQGSVMQRIRLNLHKGINEIRYQPQRNTKGVLYCTLEVDGVVIGSQKMFAK